MKVKHVKNPNKEGEESFKMRPVEVKVEAPKRQLSPLIDRIERDLLLQNALGHSLDSKMITSALGYLDLKQICLCLAHALDKHIQFS